MDEKKKDEKVLLVAPKDDSIKVRALHKSSAKDGVLRMLLPSMENLDDFLKVDKNSSILEDFFHNFRRQYEQPTEFRFYQIPASLLESLDVFIEMLKSPDENKDFISQYEVNPDDYVKKEQQEQQEQKEPQEETVQEKVTQEEAVQQVPEAQPGDEQPAQPLGIDTHINWAQLARLGVTRESLEQSGDLSAVLAGGKSGLLTISTDIEGIPITTQGRIHYQRGKDGTMELKIDCYRRTPALDLPFHGILLDKEMKANILATGNAGQPVPLSLDGNEPKPCLISLDKLTNNLVAVPVDDILIPMEIKDVTLTPEQHRQLTEGRKVLVEGMTSQWDGKFDAYMQYNVATEKFDHKFDGLDKDRYKKQFNRPVQAATGKDFFTPKRLLGKELTPEQREKFGKLETIYVTGMKDTAGNLFNAYVRMNLDRGKPDFFKYNPDKAKSQAREVTPAAEHKTQVAVNNGATDEATKYVKKPLKSAQGQPEQTATAKKEVKKRVKSKKI